MPKVRSSSSPKKSRSSGTTSSVRKPQRQSKRKSSERYSCILCDKTVAYRGSMRRHLFMLHKIEGDIADNYYETVRFPSSRDGITPEKETEEEDDEEGDTQQTNGATNSLKSGTEENVCSVGCQVSCLNCLLLKQRAEELEAMLADVLQSAETTKAILEKLK